MEAYLDGCELVWRRVFPGVAEQAHHAREFVAFLLRDLPTLDDAILVTGELVANALRHTASSRIGGSFLVEVRRRFDGVTIALTDEGGPQEPRIPQLDDMAECGRGLYTVRALAAKLTWSGDNTSRTFTAMFDDSIS